MKGEEVVMVNNSFQEGEAMCVLFLVEETSACLEAQEKVQWREGECQYKRGRYLMVLRL